MESEAKGLCSIFMKFIKIFKYSQQLTWNYGIFLSLFPLSDHGHIRGLVIGQQLQQDERRLQSLSSRKKALYSSYNAIS